MTPGDHPRMRGEDDWAGGYYSALPGSPPHARGRPPAVTLFTAWAGITPACAGKTDVEKEPEIRRWDHPRMRGEDAIGRPSVKMKAGSPPHARGRH